MLTDTFKYGTEPRYFLADAAILADTTTNTLYRWVLGSTATSKRPAQRAYIKLDAPHCEPLCLSFFNVIEAGFLAAYRKKRVSMPAIRSAIEYAEQHGLKRPLLEPNFEIGGRELFQRYQAESGEKILVASRGGQLAWPDAVADYIKSIDYDKHGPILRWVFGRERPIVAINPRVGFGFPIIARNGLRTDVVAGRFQSGESHEEIAEDFDISVEEVEEALRWENEALRREAPRRAA